MTDVNRYRDGELSSTALMQDAMERAHAVAQGEGKKLEWHKDHESMDQARARMHEQHVSLGTTAVIGAASGAAGAAAKGALSKAPQLLNTPGEVLKHAVASQLKYAGALTAAEYAVMAAGLAGVAVAVGEVVVAFHTGDDLRHRSDVDALDVATTNLLDLHPEFKRSEWKRHTGIAPNSTMALFEDAYGKATEFGKQHVPELQAAADAGSNAALMAMKMGGPPAYFEQRPDMRKRFEEDVAFSKGFSNVLFIAARAGADEKLKSLEARMAERTVRNDASLAVRG